MKSLNPTPYRAELPLALFVAVIAAVIHGPLLNRGLNVGDEGYLVYGIQRLVDGEILYRDFNRNYMPGVYYMFVPLFRWLGSDLVTTRVVWLLWLAALCAGSYLLVRPQVPRRFAVLAGLLPAITPAPIHKTFVPATAVAGLLCCRALLAAEVPFRRALTIGIGLGLISLFRQDTAAFSVAVAAGTLLLKTVPARRWRRLGTEAGGVATGIVLVWIPVLVPLAVAGALRPMLEQVVLSAAAVNAGLALPYPSLIDGGMHWYALPFYFPATMAVLGTGLAVAAWVRRRFAPVDSLLLQWSLVSVLLHSVVMQRSDSPHLRQILVPPMLILVTVLARGWRAQRDGGVPVAGRWVTRAGLVAASVIVLALGRWGLSETIEPKYRAKREGVLLDERRARVVVGPDLAAESRQLLGLIRERTEEGEPIFIAPYGAMYYFLAERPNPTPYDLVFPGSSASEERQREIRDRLEQAEVELVLIWNVAFDGREERRFLRHATVLDEYLRSNFRRRRAIGKWEVFVRAVP